MRPERFTVCSRYEMRLGLLQANTSLKGGERDWVAAQDMLLVLRIKSIERRG